MRQSKANLQRGQGNLVGTDRLEHGIAVVGCTYREARETLQRGQGNLTERPGKPYREARETLWAQTDWSTVSLLLVVLTERPGKPCGHGQIGALYR